MELNLKIISILLIILAFIHAIFPKYFKWKQELNFAEHYQQAIDVCAFILYRFCGFINGSSLPDISKRTYRNNIRPASLFGDWNILDNQVLHTVLRLFRKNLEGQNIRNNCSPTFFSLVGLP
jgi:hypothetical protein